MQKFLIALSIYYKCMNSKDLDTFKLYIVNYICLKVLKGEYKPYKKILSESSFAAKFNCSRLTARSAILILSHMGILYPVKGCGHFVSENAIHILMPSYFVALESDRSETKIIKNVRHEVVYKVVYYKKDNVIGDCFWRFNHNRYKNIEKDFEKIDFNDLVINERILFSKVQESIKKIDDVYYLSKSFFDEVGEFLYEINTNYYDLEAITKKVYNF